MPTNPRAISFQYRLALVTGAFACATVVTRAALWETRDWALTGTLSGSVGYDSNLTLTRDGPEDTFIEAKPQITLSRRNSGTDFHVDAVITGTEFLKGNQPGQMDYLVDATYAYPLAKNVIPLYKSEVSWHRSSDPDQYLGLRVEHDRVTFAAEGYVPLSGKLGLRGAADAYNDEYKDRTLNNNNRWRVFAGLAYEKRPGLEASLNVGYAEGRSRPNDANLWSLLMPVRSTEVDVTAKLRGEITPKISGSVYAGFGRVTYKGGYSNRYNLPVAGADLTWGLDPRRTLVLAAYSGADYAPDGQSIETTRAFLSFTHVIIGRWQYIARGGPTYTIFRHSAVTSKDTAWEGGLEFAYNPSDRFRISLGTMIGHHDSDIRVRQYDRSLVSLNSSYRF